MNRTIRRAALGVLGAMAIAGGAPSAALAVDSSENAALRYWQAWALMSEEDVDLLGGVKKADLASADFVLSGQLRALVGPPEGSERVSAQVVELLISATAYPESDFGIQYEQGPGALVTHLTPMRRGSTLLLVDARRLFVEGRGDAAVERLVAAYRMAHHALDDRTTISTLVAQAMFQTTQGVSDYALDAGLLTPEHKARLRSALGAFDGEDPFEFRSIVRGEREVMGGWMRGELERGGAEGFVRAMSGLMDAEPEDGSLARLRSLLDGADPEAAIEAQLDVYDAMMRSIEEAWGDAERVRAIDQKLERLCGDERAPIACIMIPAMSKLHERYLESVAEVAQARERLAP